MLRAHGPLKNRATGVSPLPLYRPLFRRVILQRMESGSTSWSLTFNRSSVAFSGPTETGFPRVEVADQHGLE